MLGMVGVGGAFLKGGTGPPRPTAFIFFEHVSEAYTYTNFLTVRLFSPSYACSVRPLCSLWAGLVGGNGERTGDDRMRNGEAKSV